MKCPNEQEAVMQRSYVGILGRGNSKCGSKLGMFEKQIKIRFKGISSRFLQMLRDPSYFHSF